MHSAVLQEDRPYLVYLPQSYQNKAFAPKRYPVLYLLDGDWHFHSASGMVQYLGVAIHIPELIVVALPDGTYRLMNEHSGLALQFGKPVETNGTTLQQSEWRGLDSQKWRLKKIAVAGKQ